MNPASYSYLNEPIIPMTSIAGIRIGVSRDQVVTKLGDPGDVEVDNTGFELLKYHALMVAFQDRKVTELFAELGYQGYTPQGIRPGDTWRAAKSKCPSLLFHDEDRMWYIAGVDGLSFDIVRPPTEEEFKDKSWLVDGKWALEEYEIQAPDHAFLISIRVHNIVFEK